MIIENFQSYGHGYPIKLFKQLMVLALLSAWLFWLSWLDWSGPNGLLLIFAIFLADRISKKFKRRDHRQSDYVCRWEPVSSMLHMSMFLLAMFSHLFEQHSTAVLAINLLILGVYVVYFQLLNRHRTSGKTSCLVLR